MISKLITIEVAQFLSSEGERKSEKPGFNIKLIKNNELIGNYSIVINSHSYSK